MIFEIELTQLPKALQDGASLIIISGDGALALVKADSLSEYINSYSEQDYMAVVSNLKWKQPCIGCEE
jgi:hypothetical protein